MANTTIQIKKSGISGNVPSSLNFGEVALNYADAKLYYKSSGGSIDFINNQQSFATINSNNSLVLATSGSDTLSIIPANGITITTNTSNKIITIDGSIIFGQANSAASFANGAFTQANSAASFANGAFTQANTDYTNISISATTSSSNGLYIPVVSVAANGRITSITNTAITVSGGGGSSSGYLANSVIIANSTGYLSNTSNLL